MNNKTLSNIPLPNVDLNELKGKLIVIEGTDGVGRSSQIMDLKEWLEIKGYAVVVTGWTRSPYIGKTIQKAKKKHTLNVYTFSLLYLADFGDRLIHEIIPALKAGYIVIADRYIYTAFIRSIIRGIDKDWIYKAYGFALIPDVVFYLKIGIKDLIPRILNSKNLEEEYWKKSEILLDYWESGMDMRLGHDFYESFVNYQKKSIQYFNQMAKEFNFITIDASKKFSSVNKELKKHISNLLEIKE
ncbi:MAG: thymidylate kinase [Candidatus Goldbacteria bacterium]|nr:thymidylate kinase [Candidatus Goldiibacteriota bacterium]